MRRGLFSGIFTLFMLLAALFFMFFAKKVEAEPQATIVSTYGGIDPDDRRHHIVGEVLNSGDTALERVFPSATFYASNGTVVGTEWGMSRIETLLPGRKSPFEITLEKGNALEVDHYSLNVSFVPTTPTPIGLEILSHRSYIDETEEILYIFGELKNIGSQGTWHIHVIATFYDETVYIVDCYGTIHHARSVLNASQETEIQAVTWGEKVENITSYRLTAESLHYEVKEEKEGNVDPTQPMITILSPTNTTYQTDPQLHFNFNKPFIVWMGYSLDGQNNVTVTENKLNLTGLSNGSYNLTVYANDIEGKTGRSETVYFSINKKPKPEPEEPDQVHLDIPAILAVIEVGSATTLLICIIIRRQKIRGNNLKRKIAAIGAVMLAIVIVAIVFSFWQIPFREQEPYNVPQSTNLLSESFVVPYSDSVHRTATLRSGDFVHIHFTCTSVGLDWGIDYVGFFLFYVLDEVNYLNWKAHQNYSPQISLYPATTIFATNLTVPSNDTYYFVWDNNYNLLTPQIQIEVTANITRNWNETAYRDVTTYHTIIPSEYSSYVEYLGIASILFSIAVIVWGYFQKEKAREQH